MTPPAELPAEGARTEAMLKRIADVLDVPMAAFFEQDPGTARISAQATDLVAAFAAIKNPGARRTCLAFVCAMAEA